MSNCVVGSGGFELPCSIIAEHSVEGCDHFSHDGDDDDLGFLVGVGETIGEGTEGGIVSACSRIRRRLLSRLSITSSRWPAWRLYLLWGQSDRRVPACGQLCRSHPQG